MWPAFVPLVASLVASVSAADVIGTGVETLDANATLRYALGGHERAGLDALFAAVDADGDGGVSLTELGTFLAFADDELELTETTAAAVRALHRAGDADTDGALSPAEFDAALVARADETSVERDLGRRRGVETPRARPTRSRVLRRAPSRAPLERRPSPATATSTRGSRRRRRRSAAAAGGGGGEPVARAVRHRPPEYLRTVRGVLRRRRVSRGGSIGGRGETKRRDHRWIPSKTRRVARARDGDGEDSRKRMRRRRAETNLCTIRPGGGAGGRE